CQLPDYRKIAPAQHVEIVGQLFAHLCDHDRVPEDWMASQLKNTDRVDGDIDALSARIAHVRTWTFVANRNAWLQDPMHWQERTRALEDRLSDALHEKLTQRFVDRRTSVLMRRLREKDVLDAIIAPNGDVQVEGQHIGWLAGFRFTPDSTADDLDGKAVRAAAQKALAAEIQRRAEKVALADDGAFALDADGGLRWIGEVIAKLSASDDVLRPKIILLADEQLTGGAREMVDERLGKWLDGQVTTHLGSLKALRDGDGLEALARGIGFRLAEAMGNIDRREIADDVKALDQDARATLRKHGVRFGAYTVFVPHLLKPAPVNLLSLLWALANGGTDKPGLRELPQLNASGRTSIPVDPAFDVDLYPICGFRVCGGRAVRFDILERLADIIRPLIAFRPSPPPEASGEKSADLNSPNQTMGEDPSSTDGSVEPKAGGELPKGTDAGAAPQQPEPELHERAPEGAAPGNGFYVTVEMTSLLGCAGEDFANVLKSLGYRVERKTVPAAARTPAVSEAPTEDPEPPTEHKETVGSASDDVVEQAESTTPPAATDTDGTSAVEPPTEQIIEIWRPAGGGNRRRQGARPHGRRQGKMGAGQDASSKPNGDRRNEGRGNNRKSFKGGKSPRRDDKRDQRKPKDYSAGPANKGRGPDPDSPFAALAGLLDKKDGDG
ncbi:MAG: helicase, partial [Pseudomonadota bacterium]